MVFTSLRGTSIVLTVTRSPERMGNGNSCEAGATTTRAIAAATTSPSAPSAASGQRRPIAMSMPTMMRINGHRLRSAKAETGAIRP